MRVTLRAKVDYTLESFELIEWHKSAGDKVNIGDTLFTYETQKSTADYLAEQNGVLIEVKVSAGMVVSRAESEDPDNWNIVGYLETD